MNDVSSAVSDLIRILEQCGVRYFIGGSLSSSINGIYRSTNDIDVILEFKGSTNLIRELKKSFLVDDQKLIERFSQNRSYNIFHESTALKIDLFPSHNEFHQSELNRAIEVKLPETDFSMKIATPEDIILAKLIWLQQSKSDRQTNDILSVISVNKNSLEIGYLKLWAKRLQIEQELDRVLAEAL